jgi:hypothetical protein
MFVCRRKLRVFWRIAKKSLTRLHTALTSWLADPIPQSARSFFSSVLADFVAPVPIHKVRLREHGRWWPKLPGWLKSRGVFRGMCPWLVP